MLKYWQTSPSNNTSIGFRVILKCSTYQGSIGLVHAALKALTDESKVNFQHNIYSYNLNDFHGSFINEDQHQCCNKNISTNLCSSLHNHVAINTKQCKWYRGGWTVFTTATCKVRSTDMEHLSFNMIKTAEAKIQSCFSLEELKSRMKIIGLG